MILWLNPVGGASGDMLLAALLDAGADLDRVREAVAGTGLTGWTLRTEAATRGGIAARRALVEVADDAPHRSAAELLALVGRAAPRSVAQLATRTIGALAEVEAAIHGVPAETVHLHELGGHDTVVDVVGVAAALDSLGVSEVFCAPLPLGAGVVDSRHGPLPVPAPATLALLRGAAVTGVDTTMETVTPTAAALLHALGTRYAPMPELTIASVGYGAGGRELTGRPNVLVAVVGAAAPGTTVDSAVAGAIEPMTVIATNVDDVSGEVLGYTMAVLLELGAADTWLTPIVGKKGRPGHQATVLCRPDLADALEARLLAETGSLGARRTSVLRRALPRAQSIVSVDGTPVRVKHGPHRSKVEYDDAAAVARASGRPLREVADEVQRRSRD